MLLQSVNDGACSLLRAWIARRKADLVLKSLFELGSQVNVAGDDRLGWGWLRIIETVRDKKS